ncbi:phage holin family protein [Frigoribacterium sp. PhB116]|uniref:phage holin family protein n=1 Tax=Frigoribacterium sp. PhB116 TaxID=2485174 RepID=UPI0010E5325B|nr:phage holin family protein [Frigoribacterium sp. PhB116]TDT63242.1 putative superfamily III holin-X [Frigoribacterium sp. PhB116]
MAEKDTTDTGAAETRTDDGRTGARLRDQLSSRADQLGSRAIEPIVKAVRGEIGKAKAEVADRARSARTGLVLVGVGAVLALVTVGLLAAVAVTALAVALPLWAATLIAFAVFAIVSAVVLKVGVSALGRGVPPVPADTIAGLTSRGDESATARD